MLLTTLMPIAWGSGAALGALQACEEGVGEACRLAAEAFLSGDGVDVDFERAIALFGSACELGSGESCILLAERYRDGVDVEADPTRSAEWYGMACEHGLGDACRMAGDLHDERAFAEASDALAEHFYRTGCDHGDAPSCMAVVAGLTTEDDAPSEEALAYLERACVRGALEGCTTLAEELPRQRALPWQARACTLGHVASCRDHGMALATGSGVPRDRAAGRAQLDFACEAEDPTACAALGDLLRRSDPVEAFAAASRACGLGVDKACRRAWRLRRKVEP